MPPKPSGPPENGNAALTGHQDGAKNIGKKLAASKSQNYAATAAASTTDDHRTRVARAKHLEIDRRYAWDARQKKRRGRPALMLRVRLRELERLFASRWGTTLPDDDAGRDDLLIAAHHIAAIYRNPEEHIPEWVREWAPWLSDADCKALVTNVAANPLKWTADKLAWRLRLAVLRGDLDMRDFASDPEAQFSAKWIPPKREWPDPLKDSRAEIESIHAGLMSRREAVASRGWDVEQLDEEIAADHARATALGLQFGMPHSPLDPTEPLP